MRKNLFTVILAFVSIQLFSQEGLPFYNHYLVADEYLLNPSYAGANPEVMNLTATYRNQWADLPESPKTMSISAHATVVDRLAFGMLLYDDENGLSSARGLNVTAAYHIPINPRREYRDDELEDLFSFGLSYHFFQNRLDVDKIIVNDPNDPLLRDPNYNLNYFNMGTSFRYMGAFGGVAVQNIPLVDNEAIANGIEPVPTWYNFILGYNVYLTEGIFLYPSVIMNLSGNSSRKFDLNLMSHISFGDFQQGIDLGLTYRSDTDKNGAQGLSVSPVVKLKIGELRIGMSYDIGLSDIAKEGGNGILFSLGYDFSNPFKPDFR